MPTQEALRKRLGLPLHMLSLPYSSGMKCIPDQHFGTVHVAPRFTVSHHRINQGIDCSGSGSHTRCNSVEVLAGLTSALIEDVHGTCHRHFDNEMEEAERKRDLRSTQAGDARCGVGALFAGHCTSFCA